MASRFAGDNELVTALLEPERRNRSSAASDVEAWQPRSSQLYYSEADRRFGGDVQPMLPEEGTFSRIGDSTLVEPQFQHAAWAAKFSGQALHNRAQVLAAKKAYEEAKKAAAKQKKAGIFGAIASVAGTLGGALIAGACDMRLKHDVAPLERSECDDLLSQLAFAVREIREHA